MEKKIGAVDTKIRNRSGLVTKTVFNKKSLNKIPNTSSSVTTTDLNAKINEIENKIPDHAKNITT